VESEIREFLLSKSRILGFGIRDALMTGIRYPIIRNPESREWNPESIWDPLTWGE